MYTVYKHVSPTNKVYVGITSKNPEKRWQRGLSYRQNVHFNHAIEKYGWDAFEHIIVAEGLTKEQAEEMEITLIAHYRSNEPEYGYNIASGGHSNSGYHHSEETRRKIGEGNRGKKRSDETRRKLSETHKGIKLKPFTEEHRKHLSEAAKKRGISDVTREKARVANTGRKQSEETIMKRSEALKGHSVSDETRAKIRRGNSKKVCQYTKDGVFVKEWDSLKQAQEELGMSNSILSQACKGKIKTAGGYIWKYKQQNNF